MVKVDIKDLHGNKKIIFILNKKPFKIRVGLIKTLLSRCGTGLYNADKDLIMDSATDPCWCCGRYRIRIGGGEVLTACLGEYIGPECKYHGVSVPCKPDGNCKGKESFQCKT